MVTLSRFIVHKVSEYVVCKQFPELSDVLQNIENTADRNKRKEQVMQWVKANNLPFKRAVQQKHGIWIFGM